MTNAFWRSPLYRVVKKMKDTGNQPGVIRHWKAMVEHWASRSNSPDAEAVKAMLPFWQERPFYTAAELAPIFPALAVALGVSEFYGRLPPAMSPKRMENALNYAGLPSRKIGDTRYYAVEQIHLIDDMVPAMQEFHDARHT